MKQTIIKFTVTTVLLFSVLLVNCSKKESIPPDGKIKAAVSILPLADFTRQIGGDKVEVEVLVLPGHSPHTYEPTASQLKFVSKAHILVLNGVGLEFWAENIINASQNPNLEVVETAEGIEIIGEHHTHNKENHKTESGNPHIWLDPVNAQLQVNKITEAFVRVDAENSEFYRENAEKYIDKLIKLDNEIKEKVWQFTSRKFISFHGGFAYFVQRYGLEEAGVIERSPGVKPSPAEVRNIISTAKKYKVKAIFAEPQFSPNAAEVIASECGAKVIYLNPLGLPPDYKYINMMQYNITQLEKALR